MPRAAAGDDLLRIVDGIQNAIVSHAETPASARGPEAFDATRTRVLGQGPDASVEPCHDRRGQCTEIALGRGHDRQAIRH
jgi:hypothetical protein